jgi:hypothetical protein
MNLDGTGVIVGELVGNPVGLSVGSFVAAADGAVLAGTTLVGAPVSSGTLGFMSSSSFPKTTTPRIIPIIAKITQTHRRIIAAFFLLPLSADLGLSLSS